MNAVEDLPLSKGIACPSVFTFPNGEEKPCQRRHHATRARHERHEWSRALPGGGEIKVTWTERIKNARLR